MNKPAKEVMLEIVFDGFVNALTNMKSNSGSTPNKLLMEIAAVHSNTTYEDLPEHTKQTLQKTAFDAFNKLKKNGYTVGTLDR